MLRTRLIFPKASHSWAFSLFSALLLLVPLLHESSLRAQAYEDVQKQVKEALDLFEKGRHLEALPLFQHLDEIEPDSAVVKAHLGFCLIALSVTKSDPQERAQIRIRARKYLLEAQALGNRSNLVRTLLEGLPEDGGSSSPFSTRKDVEAAMRDGETAFAKGDLDEATDAYQRALLLDPSQYYAALFIGDACYKKKEMDKAGEWFAHAIAIDPDIETAYRYWGDALAYSHKNGEAIEKYIDAIVAQPYNKQASMGLIQFAQQQKVTLIQPHIVSPNSQQTKGEQTNITIDANTLGKKDGSASWLAYELSRAQWHGDKFKKDYPTETEYRHSLNEEAEALGLVASSVEEQLKSNEVKSLDPTLATLLKLKQEGLIEAYILISAPDEGIAKDYTAYRAVHRELVHRYIAEYIAAPLVNKQ